VLREAGVAVRRADTFPGLGPDHIRVAVRPAAQVVRLAAVLADALVEVGA
jgi:histidinol-phosphate aminotransferase